MESIDIPRDSNRSGTDVRVITGVVVVALVAGLAIYGIYYFAVARPAAEELEEAKTSALSKIYDRLRTIGTPQASSAASSFEASVRATEDVDDITTILTQVESVRLRELKRKELYDQIDLATVGVYHSRDTVENLQVLYQELTDQVGAKTTYEDLETLRLLGVVEINATPVWRNFMRSRIEQEVNKYDDVYYVLKRGSSVELMKKDDALSLVGESSWALLRTIDFDEPKLVSIPISGTFERAPDLRPGMEADIYTYDTKTGEMTLKLEGAKILETIYSSEDLGTVAWTLRSDETTATYSTDIWEALKAEAAGRATGISWEKYALDVMEYVRRADTGKFEISVIYVVAVPEDLGVELIEYELYVPTTDILLIPPLISGTWQYEAYTAE